MNNMNNIDNMNSNISTINNTSLDFSIANNASNVSIANNASNASNASIANNANSVNNASNVSIANNANSVNNASNASNWRRTYFDKDLCKGSITNNGDGNIEISGNLKISNSNVKIVYWAANPPDYNVSFSGSGLPFPSPEVAFDNTKNIGSVNAVDGNFKIKLFYPNAYYVGLGSLYIPPHVHLKICESGYDDYFSIKIGNGVPYRTLTHPAPPSKNFRLGPTFYNNSQLTVRSQERILRDSGYPNYNTIPPNIPDNFWGKRPPR